MSPLHVVRQLAARRLQGSKAVARLMLKARGMFDTDPASVTNGGIDLLPRGHAQAHETAPQVTCWGLRSIVDTVKSSLESRTLVGWLSIVLWEAAVPLCGL
jgi:hypothetical protein